MTDNKKRTIDLSWKDVQTRVVGMVSCIRKRFSVPPDMLAIYGIPRGGAHVAGLLAHHGFGLTEDPVQADAFVDDIIDSGKTERRYANQYVGTPFFALINKRGPGMTGGGWITFPWERMQNEIGPEDNVVRMLEFIGEDPNREGLLETPSRVVKAWGELFTGYRQDPIEVMKVFEDGACKEMVVLRDIEFYSHCEHHLMPFFGKAHIGYIPDGKVLGISKLARLLDIFARRLQIQERLGQQITNALMKHLEPLGCGCVLEAQHFCMTMRGVQKQNSVMVTSSLQGAFQKSEVRNEFLRMIGK
jgi:GTP cyclohydrolase IA